MKLSNWFRSTAANKTITRARRAASQRTPRCRPVLELLEDRLVPAGFAFTNFSNASALTLVGDASIASADQLRLTPALPGQEGAAWFTAEQMVVGAGFETTFQFQLNVDGGPPPDGSDGFAFLIQNTVPTYLAGNGGTLGYDGLKNSLAVEFDTFQNSEANDPSQSHISVHTNGTGANGWSESLSLGSYNTNPILDNGAVHTAKIAYTPGSMAIYLDDMTTPKFTVGVDLAEILNLGAGKAWVGFTAATGLGYQNHDILNWNYTVTPDVTTIVGASDTSVVEGNAGTSNLVFTINRSGDTSGTATVNWITENRTATAGSDFTADFGQVTFAANQTQATVSISVSGDTAIEQHETLALRLTSASGASIADGVGIGTILNEDTTVSIGAFPPYWAGSGHYYTLTSALLNWQQAEAEAVALGGHLVTINSQAEQDFLEATFFSGANLPGSVWLGLTDQTVEGTFVWSSGEVVTYTNWFPGEPNNLTNEDFAIIGATLAGRWNDAHGTDLYYGIIELSTFTQPGSDVTVIEGDTTIQSLGALLTTTEMSGVFAGPYAMILGEDGLLYVSSLNGNGVYRYDTTGSPVPAPGKPGAEFVSPGSGGLNGARDIAFGPDDYLYVVSEGTDAVLRFDPDTGEFTGELVASGAGGLDAPRGLTFQDGYVYVTSVGTETASVGKDSVLRFDAVTGTPAGVSGVPGDAVFIASGSGGLDNPSRIIFRPDGKAYVSSTAPTNNSATANSVLRYDGATGAPAGISGQSGDAVFVSPGSGGLDGPIAMVFGPDGYLYVTSWRNDAVLRYDSSTGAFVSTVVAPGNSGGLDFPVDLLFEPDGNFLVTSRDTHQILRYGPSSQAVFTVVLSSASALPVTVNYATAAGTASAGGDFTTTSGTVSFAPGETTRTILVKTIDDILGEPTETFTINLSNPVGATITDAQGVATILDNETKFYVVDDATSNLTYEYGSGGAVAENYALNSGNTAPRGAASAAAGTTVWVVDANKKVYVYNSSGVLLGSWTAGGLNAQAQVEGIATNGTDIWLVDNKQDKVFKYTGAASRLSGSQNAASSFNLNSANKDAKDIVTDGTSLWVVNDSTTDKVFKYTVAGALLGSWTIDAANASPTGITLDPSNPAHLWIVDSGTDRVYQYDNAVSRTSGSQSASLSFALAAGNTNPQGIADPPVSEEAFASESIPGGVTTLQAQPFSIDAFNDWYGIVAETPAVGNESSPTAATCRVAMPFADEAVRTDTPSPSTLARTQPMSALDQAFAADLNSWLDLPSVLEAWPVRPLGRMK